MFRQDFTCPALLMSRLLADPYGAITHYCAASQPLPVTYSQALAWSAFARHY